MQDSNQPENNSLLNNMSGNRSVDPRSVPIGAQQVDASATPGNDMRSQDVKPFPVRPTAGPGFYQYYRSYPTLPPQYPHGGPMTSQAMGVDGPVPGVSSNPREGRPILGSHTNNTNTPGNPHQSSEAPRDLRPILGANAGNTYAAEYHRIEVSGEAPSTSRAVSPENAPKPSTTYEEGYAQNLMLKRQLEEQRNGQLQNMNLPTRPPTQNVPQNWVSQQNNGRAPPIYPLAITDRPWMHVPRTFIGPYGIRGTNVIIDDILLESLALSELCILLQGWPQEEIHRLKERRSILKKNSYAREQRIKYNGLEEDIRRKTHELEQMKIAFKFVCQRYEETFYRHQAQVRQQSELVAPQWTQFI